MDLHECKVYPLNRVSNKKRDGILKGRIAVAQELMQNSLKKTK